MANNRKWVVAGFLLACCAACAAAPAMKAQVIAGKPQPETVRYIQEYEDLKGAYDQLLAFKDLPDFHQQGFATFTPYNTWLEQVKALKEAPSSLDQDHACAQALLMLGMHYQQHAGQDDQLSGLLKNQVERSLEGVRIDRKDLTSLLITGDSRGAINPIRSCCKIEGGLAARAYRINEVREAVPNVLLLDNGNSVLPVTAKDRKPDRITIKAMNRMGYDAMGLGLLEMILGEEGFKSLLAEANFPVVASNLTFDGPNDPRILPFFVKKIGGIRVVVVSVQPTLPAEILSRWRCKSVPPREALERVLPLARQDGDFTILLSHLSVQDTSELLKVFGDLDMAVCTGKTVIQPRVKPLLTPGPGGNGIALAQVLVNEEKGKQIARQGVVPLNMANTYFDKSMQDFIDGEMRTSSGGSEDQGAGKASTLK